MSLSQSFTTVYEKTSEFIYVKKLLKSIVLTGTI